MWDLDQWCGAFVGAVFIFSFVRKLMDVRGWISQAAELSVPKPIALVVVAAEGSVGVLLVAQLWPRPATIVSLVMLMGFSALIASLLVRGRRPVCACFGASSAKPISWMTLARNMVFIAANVVALLGASS